MQEYTVRIVRTLPHNPESFTQGLLYHEGFLYESTGLYGRSSLQKIDVMTGEVQQFLKVPEVFAEGLKDYAFNFLIKNTLTIMLLFILLVLEFSNLIPLSELL